MKKTAIVGVLLLSAQTLCAVEPQFRLSLDGTTAWAGRDGDKARPAVVYGESRYTDGVSGQGLDVSRRAYDQVTALSCDGLPGFSTRRGTAAFWFKPNWNPLDGELHRIFCGVERKWRPFRFYLIKTAGGVFELSFAPSQQIQFLRRDFLKKDEWAHIAFSWDAADGSVCLYLNGRLVERKVNPSAFDFPEPQVELRFECGEGTDRFTANVGDGMYDEIRFYDQVLSEAEVFFLATGGERVKLRQVTLSQPDSFRLTCREPEVSSARVLAKIGTSRGASLSLFAMGASRRMSLVAEKDGHVGKVETADTLVLTNGYDVSLDCSGCKVRFLVDGGLQGTVDLNADVGVPAKVEVADGVFLSSANSRRQVFAPMRKGEERLWSLRDAECRSSGARKAVSLNGFWRTWPVNDYTGFPPDEEPGYMRVPGSFRSPLWNLHRLKDGELDAGLHEWHGRDLTEYRCAWYERVVELGSRRMSGGRLWLVFDHLNADSARIWWNGRLVKTVRQDFKSFTMVPNRVRIDVTDRLSEDGRNVLRLYVDRHYVNLWRGRPAIGDHGEICLGDVWLERTPSPLHLKSAVAFPSWRNKTVSLRVRVANPKRQKGRATVSVDFTRKGERPFSAVREVGLTGDAEQVVTWTERWCDPTPWSVETPDTYAMDASLFQGGERLDSYPTQRFGFREFWVENGGFVINGIPTRLRMWTSPGLERLRYYYGHPDAVDQYVSHVKWLNYDTVRDEPWGKCSIVGLFEYLDACDRLGLYNLHQMPTYEDESPTVYEAEVERFVEAYGNHPSIILWYTDFNTCSYPWNQDPAKLNDVDYMPSGKQPARRRARFAEETMRRFDPSRELFQHAGGNSGRIFTSMNYQSLGTPFQEQEDWPAQWAVSHVQPLMVVESAFPFPGQFDRFDLGAKEHLGAEQAARYFGEAAFSAERYPVPHSSRWCWTVDTATGDDPNFMNLSALNYSRVVRAWRGYGMSALGDFPAGRDHTRVSQTFEDHCAVYRPVPGNPKSCGLKPEVCSGGGEVVNHLLADYTRPDYLCQTVRACFEPLLVFVGGDPKSFTNKDHAFFVGERFDKSLVVVNDRLSSRSVEFSWRFGDGQSRSERVEVAAGGIVRCPIALTAPEVAEKTTFELEVFWRTSEGKSGRESLPIQVFPRRKERLAVLEPIVLFDPVGNTEKILKSKGVHFRKVGSLENLGPQDRLVVGQSAFAAHPLPGELPRNVRFALVFEQPTNALGRFVMVAPSVRDAFPLVKDAPSLKGLDGADLANWKGPSDTVPAFVVSDECSPHYPRSKWKCGNGGIVSGCVIRKPSRGNFVTIVESGFNLQYASLLEEVRENGRVTWCQLDVTCRYGKDPAATKVLDNLLESFARPVPDRAKRCAMIGNAADQAEVEKLGAALERWNGTNADVVFVFPGADVSALPFAYEDRLSWDFRTSLPVGMDVPGVSGADVYFRQPNLLPMSSFLMKEHRGIRFVFLRIGPGRGVKGLWNEEKLSRVWSLVLGAYGVRMRPQTPYVENLDLYDGDAFHNW